MALEITSGSHAVRVRVSGDVDVDSAGALEDALRQLGVYNLNLDVDLSGVTFMDSPGLNMLVRIHVEAADRGVSLTVIAPPEHVRRLFEITGVDADLSIVS